LTTFLCRRSSLCDQVDRAPATKRTALVVGSQASASFHCRERIVLQNSNSSPYSLRFGRRFSREIVHCVHEFIAVTLEFIRRMLRDQQENICAVLLQAQVKYGVRRHDCEFASAPEAAPNFTCDPVFHETHDTHFGCLSEQDGDSFLNCLRVIKPTVRTRPIVMSSWRGDLRHLDETHGPRANSMPRSRPDRPWSDR
jgi:hypothetical protein